MGYTKGAKRPVAVKMIGDNPRAETLRLISKRYTAMSKTHTTYQGQSAFGGIHPKVITWAARNWHATAEPPATDSHQYFDIVQPSEFLVSQTSGSTDPQSLVGFDHYNAPKDIIDILRANQPLYESDHAARIWMKVNSAKHRFFFTNYSRISKTVYIQHCIGPQANFAEMGTPYLSGATRVDFNTPLTWADQWHNMESIVIPGTLDNGDAGVTVFHDVEANFNSIFGENYSKSEPETTFEYPGQGGYIQVENEYLETGHLPDTVTFPFLRTDPQTDIAPDSQEQYQYKLKFWVKINEPHEELVHQDEGVSALVADKSNTLTTKGMNMAVASRWDLSFKIQGQTPNDDHYGEFARDATL